MLKDIAPKPRPGRIDRARTLRRELTLPEGLLWLELRKRPGGLKFRRQHPSGVYVLDFFCSDARLAIEVDSWAHSTGDRPARDDARDVWFEQAGVATLRIPAAAVLDDVASVIAGILVAARGRLPLHHPAAPGGPPPRDKLGEE
jgi:very-short-patch-repair endonuclease